jgi:hypothetical protein
MKTITGRAPDPSVASLAAPAAHELSQSREQPVPHTDGRDREHAEVAQDATRIDVREEGRVFRGALLAKPIAYRR